MIKIRDIETEFVITDEGFIMTTEQLVDYWNEYTDHDKIGWFTAEPQRLKLDAVEIIQDAIQNAFENEEADAGMNVRFSNEVALDDRKIKKMQEILDDITNSETFMYYEAADEIDPKSKI